MLEPQERYESFTAEREVEARDERGVAVYPEAEAIRHVHVADPQIARRRGDSSRVDEQRTVERPPRFPPVLRGERQAVALAKPELAEPAQHAAAAERGLVVEGDVASGFGIRQHGRRTQRQGPEPVGE